MRRVDRANGAALAVLAAALFAGFPLESRAHSDADEEHDHGSGATNGKCVGGNSCQGQSACKTANSLCAGQNACNGQGFTITTEEACDEAGGDFEAA